MKLGLFATGGTIAMEAPGEGGGARPRHGADALAAIASTPPGVTVERHDLFAKPSASITLADVQSIADRILAEFAAGLVGAVITHGTDTLEETAYALSLMLPRTKPVVLTGAMRSAGAPGADGPANLSAALLLAASPEAHGQGPLVVFGDQIHAAHLVRKIHSSRPHAFSSEPYGPIGQIVENRVRLAFHPVFDPVPRRLDGPVPAVPILQVGLDLEPETVSLFAGAPIGGLVLAGVGGGHVSTRAVEAVERLAATMPVLLAGTAGQALRSSYGYDGGEIDLARRGVINGGARSAAQVRILLQILLSNHATRATIAAAFAE